MTDKMVEMASEIVAESWLSRIRVHGRDASVREGDDGLGCGSNPLLSSPLARARVQSAGAGAAAPEPDSRKA